MLSDTKFNTVGMRNPKASSPADVKIHFRIVVAQEVRDILKDSTEQKVDQGDKECYKVFIEIDEVLKVKDVQKLDDLPCHELSDSTDIEGSSKKENNITCWIRKWSPDESSHA